MTTVYIDCNILIDWLLTREPYSYYAAKIIELTEKKIITSYVSALTLANTYYIISKELNKMIANEFLHDSARLFQFISMTETTIKWAINHKHSDFEDNLHYFAAIDNKLDYIITRNKKDFKKEHIRIASAEEFIRSGIETNTN